MFVCWLIVGVVGVIGVEEAVMVWSDVIVWE
jgi:hypothetical protein